MHLFVVNVLNFSSRLIQFLKWVEDLSVLHSMQTGSGAHPGALSLAGGGVKLQEHYYYVTIM